jgi:hypothetical protein
LSPNTFGELSVFIHLDRLITCSIPKRLRKIYLSHDLQ